MLNCPSCGAVNNDISLSCIACNRTLQIVCPQCSVTNSFSDTICSHCEKILDVKNSFDLLQKKTTDPVDEMYKSSPQKETTSNYPRAAFIKIIFGSFVFALIYVTNILSGYPLLLLTSSLISGLIGLWGLVEITFWVIDSNSLDIQPEENTIRNFPESYAKNLSQANESFEKLEKDMSNSSLMEKVEKDFSGSKPKEDSHSFEIEDKTTEENPKSKYGTLAEFLSDSLEKEVTSVKDKMKRSPQNYSLLLKLAQLHEERGEISLALENLDKCLKYEPDIAEVYLYHGILLRKDGKTDKARQAFGRALTLNKFMAKAFYQLGTIERADNKMLEARDYMQKCIQLSPDDPYAHYQLGMIYSELGEANLAIMEMRRATILHPSDSYGHSKLGQFYQKTGQYDRAASAYSQALSLKPNDAFVLEKLAEVLTEKEMYDKAAEIFQEVLAEQFQPKASTMISLGRVLRTLKKYSELNELMNEVLRIEPGNCEGLFLKAMAMIETKRDSEALILLEKLVENPDVTYEAWLELGKLYQACEQPDKAVSALIRASTSAPDQAGIWNNIGILLSNQKSYEEALKAFKKAASFDYTDTQIAYNLKSVQKLLESNCARIIESRERQIEKDPEDLDAYLEMGRAFETIQKYDNAIMAYQRLLAINPECVPGLMSYAELLRKRGKLKMAMRCYKEIIKLQPENADTHLFLIQGNLSMGFLNEALRYAVIAQKLIPDDPRVHFLLGKIYFAKGLAPRALKEFTLVAASNTDPDMISWAELMRRRLARSG